MLKKKMHLINYETFLIYFFLIAIFFAITGLGNLCNVKIFKINTLNFYENFIIGIFFLIFYLQIHIIFFPINLVYSSVLLFLLLIGFLKSIKEIKKILNIKFFLSLLICLPIVLNSKVYPYTSSIYDYGLYHNTYLNWLNQDNIVLGIANLHDRFGYSGSSYLLGAFFNFYPFFNNGFIFTTSIFFVFLIFLLIYEINFKKTNYSNIFNILILYVVIKYILVESLGDVSPNKISACLLIFLFHNSINNYNIKLDNNYLNGFITLPILITLGASTWFVVVLSLIVLFWKNFNKVLRNYMVVFLCFILCLNFGLLNFLKSGNIFYPIIFPIFETNFTLLDNSALYHIKNFPKGYPEGAEWIIPKLKSLIFSNKFVFLYLLSLISIFILLLTKYRNIVIRNWIFLKLILIISLSIFFWFLNAPDTRFAKIYFWIGFILILSLYFENFIKAKMFPILIICIFSYCIFSSYNNLAYTRSTISKFDALKLHPITNEFKINDQNSIYIRELNYSNQKFSITGLPDNIKNLVYEKKIFSKIYFKNK